MKVPLGQSVRHWLARKNVPLIQLEQEVAVVHCRQGGMQGWQATGSWFSSGYRNVGHTDTHRWVLSVVLARMNLKAVDVLQVMQKVALP